MELGTLGRSPRTTCSTTCAGNANGRKRMGEGTGSKREGGDGRANRARPQGRSPRLRLRPRAQLPSGAWGSRRRRSALQRPARMTVKHWRAQPRPAPCVRSVHLCVAAALEGDVPRVPLPAWQGGGGLGGCVACIPSKRVKGWDGHTQHVVAPRWMACRSGTIHPTQSPAAPHDDAKRVHVPRGAELAVAQQLGGHVGDLGEGRRGCTRMGVWLGG